MFASRAERERARGASTPSQSSQPSRPLRRQQHGGWATIKQNVIKPKPQDRWQAVIDGARGKSMPTNAERQALDAHQAGPAPK